MLQPSSPCCDELGRDDAPAPGFVLYHGPVNHEEDGPVEVCVPRPDGAGRLSAGEMAFTEITGGQCRFPEILGAYDAVYRWIKQSGCEAAGPAREVYVAGPGGVEQHRGNALGGSNPGSHGRGTRG